MFWICYVLAILFLAVGVRLFSEGYLLPEPYNHLFLILVCVSVIISVPVMFGRFGLPDEEKSKIGRTIATDKSDDNCH